MKKRMLFSLATVAGTVVLAAQIQGGVVASGGTACVPADCGDASGPDVIVGDILDITKWGTIGGVTGYSIGTESCNIGDENLLWQAANANHPVIAQNMYRLKDGRFEQIGMGWLKHGFTALTLNLCGCGCNGQGGTVLGVGCSDPYGAGLNGDQNGFSCAGGNICGGLGPRSEVDAALGNYAYPYGAAGLSGNALYKRIQVDNDLVDPEQNPGALYFSEGQYVTPDDAQNNNHYNNASYERMLVGSFTGGGWNLSNTGGTTRGCPAIYAWKDNDPSVTINMVDDFGKGRFYIGYNVTDNGDGTFHYEYALHNLNSHRSAREFIVPIGAGVSITNVEFHDVHYHSGDGDVIGTNYEGTDWAIAVGGGAVSWTTDTAAANANANALRWGTLYNFRFDADTGPQQVTAEIGLYRTGKPAAVTALIEGPSPAAGCPWDLDGNGAVATADLLELLGAWGPNPGHPADFDGDGNVATADLLKMLSLWGACP